MDTVSRTQVVSWHCRNGVVDDRPRKRARPTPVEKDVTDLWWDAMRSDSMIGNALPVLRYAHSEDSAPTITDPPRRAGVRTGKKRKKRAGPEAEKTLLYHMNNNIRTFRRIQNAYAKLAVLKETIAADEAQQAGDSRSTFLPSISFNDVEGVVDDRPWIPSTSGIDLGEENANDCLRWTSSKVLQHAGFQGKYLPSNISLPDTNSLNRDVERSSGCHGWHSCRLPSLPRTYHSVSL